MKLPSMLYSPTPNKIKQKIEPSKSLMGGFSIIEIMMVIVIIGALAATTITKFAGANDRNGLRDSQSKIINILEEARNRSASGADNSDHGVHVEEHELTLFSGSSYVPGDGKIITFPTTISLSTANATIIFKRIAATADPTTTITVTNTAGDNLQILVNQNGTITPN